MLQMQALKRRVVVRAKEEGTIDGRQVVMEEGAVLIMILIRVHLERE
jgi:hypothetical protein